MAGTHGRQPHAHAITAGFSNAALQNISKALSEEGAPDGILCNVVNPGPFATDRMIYLAEEKAKEEARKRELEQARLLAEEERKSKSLWQKLVWTFGVAVIAITFGLLNIIDKNKTINNNLSRASLKEANRLADSNKQDEAIALLAKTIKDNPK